jgi:YfiH family protein
VRIERARHGDVSLAFAGRGAPANASAVLRRLAATSVRLATARQIHSAAVLEARPGRCGKGDALHTVEPDLALCIVTADCVPLLLSDGERIAAVHAGWRGIVAGVVSQALSRFRDAAAVTAWIGPAIGPCCYEVGDDVACSIAAVAGPEAVRARGAGRPHADLPAAVELQLAASGVGAVETWRHCTRCTGEDWWSYRRDGPAAGRNYALIWRGDGCGA